MKSLRVAIVALLTISASTERVGAEDAVRTAPPSPAVELALQYRTTGPGCPSQVSFENFTRSRLGYDPFDDEALLHVAIEVTEHQDRLEGTVRFVDADGTLLGARDIISSQRECVALVESLAAALSTAIDDVAAIRLAQSSSLSITTRAPPRPPAPEPPEVAPSLATGEQEVSTPVAEELSTAHELHLSLGAAATYGRTPGIALGPNLSVGWHHGTVELFAGGQYLEIVGGRVSRGETISGRLLLGSIGGCMVWTPWHLCARTQFGQLAAAPRSASFRLQRVFVGYAGLSLNAEHWFSERFGVQGGLGLDIPFAAANVTQSETVLWAAPIVSGEASVSVVVRLY